ncbi:hypothetical protein PRIPAC_93645 [Pristionchus pacificus]|uniref:Uncharacterized protein n=1 Tax=Pristionchus pacificus TaxID=54126 RepID=A0A454XRM5_PRIPA|nr:hypothetical protein PRIPAC_93645 [Pristionchus pacificus]|eukprot:PDM76447.1 hypothetical protein PRIPAC_40051 [Pristionchus pacificus]
MRLLPALLFIGTVAAQQAQFQTKFMNLVTDYLGPANTGKAMDMVAQDLLAEKTIQQVMDHLKQDFMSLIPGNKLVSGGLMLNSFMTCIKKAGSSMDKAMANIVGAFTKQLTPLYKKVMTKVKAMKKNKKADKEILNQGFKIATSALTKKLVQGVINVCMAKSTKAEYDCAVPAMNTILKTSLYNMNYDKKRG